MLDLGNQRREKLQESCKAYQLVREAAELANWITEKEGIMIGEDVGEDLEQVEEYQKKFDDFRKVHNFYKLYIYVSKQSTFLGCYVFFFRLLDEVNQMYIERGNLINSSIIEKKKLSCFYAVAVYMYF